MYLTHNRIAAAAAVALLAATASVSACSHFPNRENAARGIDETIRAMPGVAATSVNYQTDFTNGAHFYLDATLKDDATADQAAAVGRTFVDRVTEAKFADFDVALTLTYREASPQDSYLNGSMARIDYSFGPEAKGGPTGQTVADNLREWIQIAESPAVRHVRLELPVQPNPSSDNGFTIRPAPTVTDAALGDLLSAHPDLNRATWRVVADPSDDTADGKSDTYVISGPPPDQSRRDLWGRIAQAVQPAGRVEARTDTLDLPPGNPPTTVTVSISRGPTDKPFDQRIRDLMPLLAQLPSPAAVRILAEDRSVELTIGACTPAAGSRTPTPLETELRSRYEKC